MWDPVAFVDMDMVIFDDSERAGIASLRTQAYMLGVQNTDKKAYEEERLRYFYSAEALYDEALFPKDTLIEGAKEKIAQLDMHEYRVIFLSSAPEYTRKARLTQLEKADLLRVFTDDPYDLTDDTALHELMLKVKPFTFTKTVTVKAGLICTLSAMWETREVIVVDNEQAILDEVVANILQPVEVYLSLADVVLEEWKVPILLQMDDHRGTYGDK